MPRNMLNFEHGRLAFQRDRGDARRAPGGRQGRGSWRQGGKMGTQRAQNGRPKGPNQLDDRKTKTGDPCKKLENRKM